MMQEKQKNITEISIFEDIYVNTRQKVKGQKWKHKEKSHI